jgi:hypothetical protein
MRSLLRFAKVSAALCVIAGFFFSSYGQAGLTLGGKFVPKDSIIVYINVGNSAMSGRDPLPDTIKSPRLWKMQIRPKSANPDWTPARESLCNDNYNTLNSPKGGPVMPFLKRLLKNYENTNYHFCVIQYSQSAYMLTEHYAKGLNEYDSLVLMVNKFKNNVTIGGIVCMLNLVEVQNYGGNHALCDNYLNDVKNMVSNMRADLNSPCTIPYIHAGYPVLAGGQYAITTAGAKSIIAQIAQIEATIPNSIVIPTEGLTICQNCQPLGYLSHYDTAGNRGWGWRTADSIKARGWVPPPGPSATCTAVSSLPNHYVSGHAAAAAFRVAFDGSTWSMFDKAGKSFGVYAPNGRTITRTSVAALRNRNLPPGVYVVRPAAR